jgi:uncharacterized protein (DUF1330 family)
MAGDGSGFVVWFGLALKNAAGYAEYRRRMTPILERHGGRFEYDFTIREVLKSPGSQSIDRVFSILFPTRGAREAFFADPDYRAVRAAHFEPSVRAVTPLASYQRA